MDITIDDLLKNVGSYNYDISELLTIKQAYDYAEQLHSGQYRQSGEAYISHPLTVAYILSDMHADCDTICAALLHDVLEDTSKTKEDISNLFNSGVAKLVDGVTKISKMNFSSKSECNLANTRKIILGLTEDVRIIIIKLADRLHNMRTLEFKSEFKQKENALETMEIFVPLAYYIGAYRIKSELEDISFRYLKPDEYKALKDKLEKEDIINTSCLNEMLFSINDILTCENIPHSIKVRTKNIYGIYKSMLEGHKLSDIHDLLSLKIMVDEIRNCYVSLGLIHSRYKPINNKFKDYICNPKTNLYSSLHTTVFGPDERLVQTQIRTFDMDKIASFGLPAYWAINQGDARRVMQEDLKTKSQLFKSLTDINLMFQDNQDFVTQVKSELFSDKIYVYTALGKVIELPKGSNIIDLACYSDLEKVLVGAKVNDELVGFDYELKNKDRVITIVDEDSPIDRSSWLDKANTSYAKKKLKSFG